eukprot:456494_1
MQCIGYLETDYIYDTNSYRKATAGTATVFHVGSKGETFAITCAHNVRTKVWICGTCGKYMDKDDKNINDKCDYCDIQDLKEIIIKANRIKFCKRSIYKKYEKLIYDDDESKKEIVEYGDREKVYDCDTKDIFINDKMYSLYPTGSGGYDLCVVKFIEKTNYYKKLVKNIRLENGKKTISEMGHFHIWGFPADKFKDINGDKEQAGLYGMKSHENGKYEFPIHRKTHKTYFRQNTVDAYSGQSGSSIWVKKKETYLMGMMEDSVVVICGVHTSGNAVKKHNIGTLFDDFILKQINNFVNNKSVSFWEEDNHDDFYFDTTEMFYFAVPKIIKNINGNVCTAYQNFRIYSSPQNYIWVIQICKLSNTWNGYKQTMAIGLDSSNKDHLNTDFTSSSNNSDFYAYDCLGQVHMNSSSGNSVKCIVEKKNDTGFATNDKVVMKLNMAGEILEFYVTKNITTFKVATIKGVNNLNTYRLAISIKGQNDQVQLMDLIQHEHVDGDDELSGYPYRLVYGEEIAADIETDTETLQQLSNNMQSWQFNIRKKSDECYTEIIDKDVNSKQYQLQDNPSNIEFLSNASNASSMTPDISDDGVNMLKYHLEQHFTSLAVKLDRKQFACTSKIQQMDEELAITHASIIEIDYSINHIQKAITSMTLLSEEMAMLRKQCADAIEKCNLLWILLPSTPCSLLIFDPNNKSEYENCIAKQVINLALGDHDNVIKWKKIKSKDSGIDIAIAYHDTERVVTVRSSVTITVTPDEFYDFVDAQNNGIFKANREYDTLCVKSMSVRKYDNNRCLVYSEYKVPGMTNASDVHPRDFCYIQFRKRYKNYRYKNKDNYIAAVVGYNA